MSDSTNYFVAAAVIAAKLDRATKVSQRLSLTASNARVVVLRAGESAAGFRPLTDAIHSLADITVSSSKRINTIAATLSKTSVQMFRADRALKYFLDVYARAKDSPNLASLDESFERTKTEYQRLSTLYRKQVKNLGDELGSIESELRSAVILKTLCETEATRAKGEYREAFISVSRNVESTAREIKELIGYSRRQVEILK